MLKIIHKNTLLIIAVILGAMFLNPLNVAANQALKSLSDATVQITSFMRSEKDQDSFYKYGESSGFLFDEQGYLFSIYSVHCNAEERLLAEKFEVEFANGESGAVMIVAVDPSLDLAIFKLEEIQPMSVVDISSAAVADIGETVLAIVGPGDANQQNVFEGIVKAKDKNTIYESGIGDLLIDAYMTLPETAHGGPLVNGNGSLLGMNISAAHIDSSGQITENEAHALPAELLATSAKMLLANPTFEQKWLGFSARFLMGDEGAELKKLIKRREGIYIDFVWEKGPAAADVKQGDILTNVNGHRLKTPIQLKRLLFEANTGTPAALQIFRDGGFINVNITIEKRPQWALP